MSIENSIRRYEQYLKKTTIYIPESIKEDFPENDTLRIGFSVNCNAIRLYLNQRGGGRRTLVGSIKGPLPIDSGDYAKKARELAGDESWLVSMLESYLDNGRIPVGQDSYIIWKMPERREYGNQI